MRQKFLWPNYLSNIKRLLYISVGRFRSRGIITFYYQYKLNYAL